MLLLCAFSVIVEPVLHIEDARRFALTGQNIEGKDVDEIRALPDTGFVPMAGAFLIFKKYYGSLYNPLGIDLYY